MSSQVVLVVALAVSVAGCPAREQAAPTPTTTPTTAPEPAPEPAPVAPSASGPAEIVTTEPVLAGTARKVHRLEIALARLDPTLHAIRITWPGEYAWAWRWPSWADAPKQAEVLRELDQLAAEPPAMPALDAAVHGYTRQIAIDAAELARLVAAWNHVEAEATPATPTRPTIIELEPVFERMGATSRSLRAALRAAHTWPTPPPGSRLALERACLAASAFVVGLPNARATAEAAGTTGYARPEPRSVGADARACVLAALADLGQPGVDAYAAGLAFGIGTAVHQELDSLRAGGSYVSSAINIAQQMSFLADRAPLERPGW